jgi:hypothetical protein
MIVLHGAGVNGNWMIQSLPFKEMADKHQVQGCWGPAPLVKCHVHPVNLTCSTCMLCGCSSGRGVDPSIHDKTCL